jgi:sulfur-oxidizing protein SoxY
MRYFKILFVMLLMPWVANAANDESRWLNEIKPQYFAGKQIKESDIISIEAPYRAEDPALVPIKILSHIDQKPERYIKKLWVFVDKNPYPFVGEFTLFPETGKADLAMRIRVNTYSNIRAVAELNNGEMLMAKKFVKASGGCSAPIGTDLDAAMKRLGKMKFRLKAKNQQLAEAQLMISHPNITGMQMDQVTRFVRKPYFMDTLTVTYNGKPVLIAKTDIAISQDPNFRFYFIPTGKGELKAEFTDIHCESPASRAVCEKGKQYKKVQVVDI